MRAGFARTMARASTIGTHDGAFHCDEVLGCWMLKRTERFKEARITRTRNEEVLKTLDAVLDVGGVYDPGHCLCSHSSVGMCFPEHLRFDHHQKGFQEVFGHGREAAGVNVLGDGL